MEKYHGISAKAGGFAHVVEQIRAQRVRLTFMRLAFAGILLLALLLVLWVVPWVPIGLTADEYDVGIAGALLLGIGTAIASLLFVIIWGPHFRSESVPEFLRVLFGAQQLIRSRKQFSSRLRLECARARKDRRKVFSLIVVQLPADGNSAREQRDERRLMATMLVRSMVRVEDIVGDSWPHEVWVLSVGAGPQACNGIMRRLAQTFARSEVPALGQCRIGGSIFGEDGDDPDALFSVAYQRLASAADALAAAA